MDSPEQEDDVFELAAQQTVDLANRIADEYPDADLWDVASGILAGAVQYWLYSRQPCGDPFCDACAEVSTAEQRMRSLLEEIRESAQQSDYYHTPHDSNVGTA